MQLYPNSSIVRNPEAQGVSVTDTMVQVGIYLEWPPKTVAYQVALAGKARCDSLL